MIKKIAKNWRVKMAAQKAIGLLPARIAFPLNDLMVRVTTGGLETRLDTVWRANKCLENLGLVREAGLFHEALLDSILEMGTGWHGIDAVVFHLLGAKALVTVDHWRHLKVETLREQLEALERGFPDLRLEGWVDRPAASQRLARLREGVESISLERILDRMNCRYEIVPSCHLDRSGFSSQKVSFFYSESVFQRIPTGDLEASVQYLGSRLLIPGGAFFIRTDQKDIHAQEHVDTSLWPFEYLKYSDRAYGFLSSEKLNYQNRLRESDFVRLLQESGLEVVRIESSVYEDDLDRIERFKVDSRFHGYEKRDLATRASRIVGRNP